MLEFNLSDCNGFWNVSLHPKLSACGQLESLWLVAADFWGLCMEISEPMTPQKAGRALHSGYSEHAAVCAVIALISVPTLDSLKATGSHCVG